MWMYIGYDVVADLPVEDWGMEVEWDFRGQTVLLAVEFALSVAEKTSEMGVTHMDFVCEAVEEKRLLPVFIG
ncbi:hypothetical protein BPOR_0306g00100 [Botrytis porri]|uniref:Uncharacterized protein n=1 Tax=Botrytis porri TaxID=87229 RepID=A0A4Z1KPS7_9HELO|nr:hypothetical protein BPOR_0306g00100 [Botrytis porri]